MNKSILIIKVNTEISIDKLGELKAFFEKEIGNEFKILMVDKDFDFALISDKDKNILLSNIEEIDINNLLSKGD